MYPLYSLVSKFTQSLSFLILLAVLTTACGGGGGDDSPPPSNTGAGNISLDASTEGGSNTAFAAELLEQGTPANNIGVVLLHGRGGNPDTAVVRQLRNDLFLRGYTTLSIQGPVPSGFAEGGGTQPPFQNYINESATIFPEAYARIRTAINTLQARNVQKIVVIGFSMGSRMASAHVARGQIDELPIIGFVGIGMYTSGGDPLATDQTLDEIGLLTTPVLDIYGDNDTNAATTAAIRQSAYVTAGGNNYSQLALPCGAVTGNDCHKLVGLKGNSNAPLEMAVANWIAGL